MGRIPAYHSEPRNQHGAVAQLGERRVRNAKVRGSIPLGSTNSPGGGGRRPLQADPVLRSHWGVEDPARASGIDAEIDAAFMMVYRILRTRIEAFLALPLTALQQDRTRLKAELDRIGTLKEN